MTVSPSGAGPRATAVCQHCTAVIEELAAAPGTWVDNEGTVYCMATNIIRHTPMPVIPPLEHA